MEPQELRLYNWVYNKWLEENVQITALNVSPEYDGTNNDRVIICNGSLPPLYLIH